MLPLRKILLIAILIASLVSFTSLFNNPKLPLVRPVHGASVHFTLYADFAGWNNTKPSGINPTITVTQGDSVSLTLIGQDTMTHLFLLDLDGNGSVLDCPSKDICSSNIYYTQTVTVPSFTANFAPGLYKYYCYYHPTTMVDSFMVRGFNTSSTPTSLTVNQGSSGTSTVTLKSVSNFAGTVGLAATVSPSGPTVSMNPSTVTLTAGSSTTSTLTFTATSGTPTGTYTVTVTGTSGSATSTTSVTSTVSAPPPGPDFGVSSNPSSLTIVQGSNANSTITVSSINSFAGTITLSAALSPAGPTTSFNVNPVTVPPGGTATSKLTISTSTGAPPGSYTVTVTAQNTTVSRTTNMSVTVTSLPSPDFTITSSPTSLNIAQGSSGTATITLTSVNSFSGTVTLTPTVSASGPQVSLNQTSITLSSGSSASAKLTAKTASSGLYSSPVSQGSYTVTVNGTSGTLSHTTTLSITVGSGSTSPSGAGNLLTPLTIGVIAAAAVIVIAAAIYLLRRKPKTPSPKLGP